MIEQGLKNNGWGDSKCIRMRIRTLFYGSILWFERGKPKPGMFIFV